MTANASALAQALSDHTDEDILQAIQLLVSRRPELRVLLGEVLEQEPPRRYVGVITCFYTEKHFGFIICDEVKDQFGLDTYLSDKEIGPFTTGSTVSFSLALSKDGRPQARLLEAVEGAPPPPRVPAKQPESWDVVSEPPRKVARRVPPPMVAAADGTAAEGSRVEGVISAFYSEKKYGFIKSDAVKQQYGMDVFLSELEISTFSVGSAVSFRIALNGKGCPQARDLRLPEGEVPGEALAVQDAAGFAEVETQEGAQQVEEKLWIQWQAPVALPVPQNGSADATAGRCTGMIKSFIPERKFGFIKSDEVFQQYQMDTFISDKEIRQFKDGDMVSFSVVVNAKGQPQARNLEAADVQF